MTRLARNMRQKGQFGGSSFVMMIVWTFISIFGALYLLFMLNKFVTDSKLILDKDEWQCAEYEDASPMELMQANRLFVRPEKQISDCLELRRIRPSETSPVGDDSPALGATVRQ